MVVAMASALAPLENPGEPFSPNVRMDRKGSLFQQVHVVPRSDSGNTLRSTESNSAAISCSKPESAAFSFRVNTEFTKPLRALSFDELVAQPRFKNQHWLVSLGLQTMHHHEAALISLVGYKIWGKLQMLGADTPHQAYDPSHVPSTFATRMAVLEDYERELEQRSLNIGFLRNLASSIRVSLNDCQGDTTFDQYRELELQSLELAVPRLMTIRRLISNAVIVDTWEVNSGGFKTSIPRVRVTKVLDEMIEKIDRLMQDSHEDAALTDAIMSHPAQLGLNVEPFAQSAKSGQ